MKYPIPSGLLAEYLQTLDPMIMFIIVIIIIIAVTEICGMYCLQSLEKWDRLSESN
jgi:hypothetical protein